LFFFRKCLVCRPSPEVSISHRVWLRLLSLYDCFVIIYTKAWCQYWHEKIQHPLPFFLEPKNRRNEGWPTTWRIDELISDTIFRKSSKIVPLENSLKCQTEDGRVCVIPAISK
jgi:hypothetical protein